MEPSIPLVYGSPAYLRLKQDIIEKKAELYRTIELDREEMSRSRREIDDQRIRVSVALAKSKDQTSRIEGLFKKILGTILLVGLLVGTWKVLGPAAMIAAAVTILLAGAIWHSEEVALFTRISLKILFDTTQLNQGCYAKNNKHNKKPRGDGHLKDQAP